MQGCPCDNILKPGEREEDEKAQSLFRGLNPLILKPKTVLRIDDTKEMKSPKK
jgi:hypothetical protein